MISDKLKQSVQVMLAVMLVAGAFDKAGAQTAGSPGPSKEPGLELMGNRFLTFSTLVRVNQIETSRDKVDGEDESSIHTPAEAELFRETIEKAWPGARITWGFSWLALNDQRTNYLELKKLIVSYHEKYGDEITFVPGGYFANMYNTREQVNRDLHDGLELVSRMVGNGYRPLCVIAGYLSADNLRYLVEKENIHVCQGNIWSQHAVDNGDGDGSVCYPYYPSREHFLKPAQGKADLIDCVNLDGWTCDFLNARRAGGTGGFRSRAGVGPIETLLSAGTEKGLEQMLATTATHFDGGFRLNNFAWITSIWELCLVEGRKIYGYSGRNGMDGLELWLKEIRRRWPEARCITHGEFGELWRQQFKDNSRLDYRFVQRGSGFPGSEPDKRIRWFMNKDFRLALLGDIGKAGSEKVIDFTRYDLPAKEPSDPKPGAHVRNWSLMNRLNQKGVRPEDKPIPVMELNADEKAIINGRYPELLNDKVDQQLIDTPAGAGVKLWPSQPPAGCPFKASESFSGVEFSGRNANYTGADTWYPSWAADGNMYSPWTDGMVYGVKSASYGQEMTTGQAKITGDDPMKLEISEYAVYKSDASPYAGRYPCGSLVYNGVWYYGTYCLHPSGEVKRDGTSYNWPWLGPFVGFRWSTDYGKTWTQTSCTPEKPLFGESALKAEPVKIGAPHFVDFGKNMESSPDGKAYLTAHGASAGPDGRRFAYNSWITGDEIYLIRVTPGVENMNDSSKYEFFAGADEKGTPVWSKDISKIKPIAAWKDNMGCVTMTYNAPLKKYFMCVTDGGNTYGYYNTYILESDLMTGPWKLVSYMKRFGEQAYFVNIPSKFIAGDGRKMWLSYSANFGDEVNGVKLHSKPAGSRYAMCLQEIRLRNPAEPEPQPGILDGADNVARIAWVRTSSAHAGSTPEGAVDGTVEGAQNDISREWVSQGESSSAMIRLSWLDEQLVDRVWLFDRPNKIDQIKGGTLVFSDGTTIKTGELPDDAKEGLEVKFPPKKIQWLVFVVEKAKGTAQNIGLSEIAVFGRDARE